jgi:hypothetical protein
MGRSSQAAVFPTRPKDGGLLLEAGSDGIQFRWSDVVAAWRDDRNFALAFSAGLAACPYAAFFWETPALVAAKLDHPFECMLLPAAALTRARADKAAFKDVFAQDDASVVRTANIGGDAELIIPRDEGSADYTHLATFLRTASKDQLHALWRTVGDTVASWLAATPERPLWLSTSGLGVSWLHVRLDTRPKYYSHAPYRQARP